MTAPSKAFLDISPEDEKHSLDDIDDKYDNLKKLILEGSHDEILRRSLALEKAKELRIAAADKHRKLQIKNINELYEYEVEDASAIYKVISFTCNIFNSIVDHPHFLVMQREYTDVQEQIINDLENEREKMKEARKLYEQQLFAGSNSSSNHGNMAPGGRSLRSSAPAETEPTDRYDTRKNNKEKSSSNNSSRKKSNGINGGLSMTIAESCMRYLCFDCESFLVVNV